MAWLLIIYLIINWICGVYVTETNISLTIEQGTLVGRQTIDYNNDIYYIFEGIPYAKPPTGALRFKAPELPEPWIGIYDATMPRPACPQFPLLGQPDEHNENCLFLNVHTKLQTDKLKPVMVWIHGGAFDTGSISTNSRGSQWLMIEDIVLVDIQYRLNVFGFLSFKDPKYGIYGNAGFKDQVMALKWIQNNINHFGGDPNQVTIFGVSAGSASVHLLYVSPLAKGLFHRAIAQSGSGANNFIENAVKYPQLSDALNCTTINLDAIVKCINDSTTEDLLRTTPSLLANANRTIVDDITLSVLTIEGRNHKDPFLTASVEEQIKNGNFNKVPIIFGICANESALFMFSRNLQPNFTKSDYDKLIPKDLNVEKGSEKAFEAGKEIKEFYYGNQTPSYDALDPWIEYHSDIQFIQKSYYIARIQTKYSPEIPLYFYKFNYLTKLNTIITRNNSYLYHGDDVNYIFNRNEINDRLDPNSDEYIGVRRMIKLWTSFAKSGNPNSQGDPLFNNVVWKPMTSNKLYYLHIHQNLELQTSIYEDRMNFWDNLYEKYGMKNIFST